MSSGSCFGPLTVAALFTGLLNMAGKESSLSIQGPPCLRFQIALAIYLPQESFFAASFIRIAERITKTRHRSLQNNRNYSSMAPNPTPWWALV